MRLGGTHHWNERIYLHIEVRDRIAHLINLGQSFGHELKDKVEEVSTLK